MEERNTLVHNEVKYESTYVIPTSEFEFQGKQGEVAFTTAIGKNERWKNSLLEAAGLASDGVQFTNEVRTSLGARVDLVASLVGVPSAVIECQNSKGDLDRDHSSKIMHYAYCLGVSTGILLCESISEEMKSYVEYLNKHPDVDLAVLTYKILRTGNSCSVVFESVISLDGIKSNSNGSVALSEVESPHKGTVLRLDEIIQGRKSFRGSNAYATEDIIIENRSVVFFTNVLSNGRIKFSLNIRSRMSGDNVVYCRDLLTRLTRNIEGVDLRESGENLAVYFNDVDEFKKLYISVKTSVSNL